MRNKIDPRVGQCRDLPWCVDDPNFLGPCIMDHLWRKESFYRRWCQMWFESFQFVYGNHDAKWIRQFGFAVDVDFLQKRRTGAAKKSKTNIARLVNEALAAAIYSRMPEWDAEPASDSARQGKSISELTKHCLSYFMKSLNCHTKFEKAAASYTCYGKIAAVVRWNPEAGMIKWVPKWRRVQKPVMTTVIRNDPVIGGVIEVPEQALDSTGQPMFEDSWEPVTGQDGSIREEPRCMGSPEVIVLTPFEIRYEEGKDISEAKWIEWIRLIDYDEFLKEYDHVDGKLPAYKTIAPEFSTARVHQFAIRQFFRMHFVSPDMESQRPIDITTSGQYLRNKVLIVEHYDKPNTKYWPKGRRVVVANGHATHITEPNYSTNKAGGWHPFVEANWFSIAPSSMAAGPMNDTIQKNRELNILDSLILTAAHRNFGSSLLVKIGSGLDANRITGTPGEIHEVNDINAARYLHDEQPIPPMVPNLRNAFKDDVYENSGAQDALRGERSKGVTAGYALRQLQEREERRITPARNKFERFVAECGEKLIACFRENVTSVGDDLMGFLKRSASGEFLPDEAISFLTRNIDLGVDINIVTGSMQAQSEATRQFNLLDLVTKTPLGQKIGQDQKVTDEFLKVFGAETLRGYAGSHRDRAAAENEVFTDMLRLPADSFGQQKPVCIFEDDDKIHIEEHTDFIIRNASDLIKNEPILKQFLTHIEFHRISLKAKMGEVAPESANMVRIAQAQAGAQRTDPMQVQSDNQQRKLNPPPLQAAQPPTEAPPSPQPKPQAQAQSAALPKEQGQPQPQPGGPIK